MRRTLTAVATGAAAMGLVLGLPGVAAAQQASVSNDYGTATLYQNTDTNKMTVVIVDTNGSDGKAVGAEIQYSTYPTWENWADAGRPACWDDGYNGSAGRVCEYDYVEASPYLHMARLRFHGSNDGQDYQVTYSSWVVLN